MQFHKEMTSSVPLGILLIKSREMHIKWKLTILILQLLCEHTQSSSL